MPGRIERQEVKLQPGDGRAPDESERNDQKSKRLQFTSRKHALHTNISRKGSYA
jgi:hypothetical protein